MSWYNPMSWFGASREPELREVVRAVAQERTSAVMRKQLHNLDVLIRRVGDRSNIDPKARQPEYQACNASIARRVERLRDLGIEVPDSALTLKDLTELRSLISGTLEGA